MRRETLFLTNYLTGLGLFAAPALISSVLMGVVGSAFGAAAFWPAMQVFAATMLGALLFFSFGVLVCSVVGQMAAAAIVYTILNFAVYLLEEIVRTLLESFVYGMPTGEASATLLAIRATPVLGISSYFSVQSIYDETWAVQQTCLSGWRYLCVLAAIGLVFAALAFWLLRRREMERCGDVVAVRALRPVALYTFTLGCSLVLGAALMELISGNAADNFWYVLLFLFIGAFIGYYAGQMLLKKTLRVFRTGWLGFGVCCAALLVVFGAAKVDIFGYSRYLPQREQIVQASLSTSRYHEYLTRDADFIDEILRLHTAVVDGKQEQQSRKAGFRLGEDYTQTVYLVYRLDNGKTVRREYELVYTQAEQDAPETLISQFETLYESPDSVRLRTGFDEPRTRADMVSAYVYSKETGELQWLDAQQAWQLYDACAQDIDAGLLRDDDMSGKGYEETNYTPLSLTLIVAAADEATDPTTGQTKELSIDSIPITAKKTTAVLRELGFELYWTPTTD